VRPPTRTKENPNGLTRDVRQIIRDALNEAGGVQYLVQCASDLRHPPPRDVKDLSREELVCRIIQSPGFQTFINEHPEYWGEESEQDQQNNTSQSSTPRTNEVFVAGEVFENHDEGRSLKP
jgi:hypothetical protein